MLRILDDTGAASYAPLTVDGWTGIGRSVRAARFRRRWSQSQLARVAGVHQSTISRLETARLTGLRWSRFATIIGALGDAWLSAGAQDDSLSTAWDRLR